jgi:hypothetical protein
MHLIVRIYLDLNVNSALVYKLVRPDIVIYIGAVTHSLYIFLPKATLKSLFHPSIRCDDIHAYNSGYLRQFVMFQMKKYLSFYCWFCIAIILLFDII